MFSEIDDLNYWSQIWLSDFKSNYKIDFTVQELFDSTPLPWASGRSWLKGIETGLSGLGRYLNIDAENSRSGGGIQSQNKIRSGAFKKTPYISKILNNFIVKTETISL